MRAPTSVPRGVAIGVLLFASFMDLLDVTIVQVALPDIAGDLHATPAQLEWMVSGYMLAFAVLLITGGRLGDIVGRQRVFLAGVGGFTVASAIASVAGSGEVLVAARVLQGGFAALMVPQLLSTLQALYAPRERAPMYGLIGGVSGMAAVIGPVLGGWLVAADVAGLGWRTIFLLNVPVGFVVFLLGLRFVPNTTSDHPLRLDVRGVALLTAALLALLYPLVEGRSLDWPAWLLVMEIAGVALVALFVRSQRRRQRRDGSALLPMPLFANRGFSAGIVTQAAFQGAMNAFTVVFLIYVQAVLGFSALAAGLTLLPFSLGAFLGTAVAVPLGTRVGKPIVTLGALVQIAGIGWAISVLTAQGAQLSGGDLVGPMALTGVGLGLLVVPLVDIALATVPVSDAGAASGAYSTFQQIGAAVGVAISGTVFFARIGADWSQPTALDALSRSAWVAMAGYGIAALASLLLPRRADVIAHVAELARAAPDDEAATEPARVTP